MTRVPIFSEESMRALQRDHERLRYEVRELRTILRINQAFASGEDGMKPFCLFEFDAVLTTGTASAAGTILAQWGYGRRHDEAASHTFVNMATGTVGIYVFAAPIGAHGIASWDPDEEQWRIIIPECG